MNEIPLQQGFNPPIYFDLPLGYDASVYVIELHIAYAGEVKKTYSIGAGLSIATVGTETVPRRIIWAPAVNDIREFPVGRGAQYSIVFRSGVTYFGATGNLGVVGGIP